MTESYDKIMFSFVNKTAKLSSRAVVPVCTPNSNEWEFLLPHVFPKHSVLSAFWTFCIPNSNEWEFLLPHVFPKHSVLSAFWILAIAKKRVVKYCLNLQFPYNIWLWTFFHRLICPLHTYFSDVSVHTFCPFLKVGWFLTVEFYICFVYFG